MVVGRDAELAAITRALDGVAGGPAVLALQGGAGIGKTTVWEAGLAAARARGFRVLASRPAAAETRLGYAGLADLLENVGGDVLSWLPAPQRQALEAALLRVVCDEDDGPDPRAVGAGFLAALERLAGQTPVLLAIDDVHWLDEPTWGVIAFAVRRCSGRIVVLTADRGGRPEREEIRPRDPARLRRVEIGPLSLGALHHVLKEHLGRIFSRRVLLRIARTSGGNPFYAVELARSVSDRGPVSGEFPGSLQAVVGDRIGALPPQVQDALLVVSALTTPRLELVTQACGGVEAVELLGPAEDGVVELSGGYVRFTHPILAESVYAQAAPTRRRAVHQQLSTLIDDVEERARHLALAVVDPVDSVGPLDAAAAHARDRGEASVAAELLELAIGRGADEPARRIRAARDHLRADDPLRAMDLLEPVLVELDPGPQRVVALATLGAVLCRTGDLGEAIETLQRAYGDAADDLWVRSEIALELGTALIQAGRLREAIPVLTRAVREAEQLCDGSLFGETRAVLQFCRYLCGEGADDAALWQPCPGAATRAALWSGDIATARRSALEATEQALIAGTNRARAAALATHAMVAAWTGQVDEAWAAGEEALAVLASFGVTIGVLSVTGTLGMLALSVGDHQGAADRLVPAAAVMAEIGIGEPAAFSILPDAAEALIGLGSLREAEPLVARLEAGGRAGSGSGRVWAQAVAARTRGLLAAADGDLDAALSAVERALDAHEHLLLPYERARTLLVLGRLQRRRNERRAAGATLEEAVRLFDAVGAARWALNARAELRRLGIRPGCAAELTGTQKCVAELAARGLTNRQVAAALVISPKTVEANLSRAYQKLGIRSRAQLGAWLAQRGPVVGGGAPDRFRG